VIIGGEKMLVKLLNSTILLLIGGILSLTISEAQFPPEAVYVSLDSTAPGSIKYDNMTAGIYGQTFLAVASNICGFRFYITALDCYAHETYIVLYDVSIPDDVDLLARKRIKGVGTGDFMFDSCVRVHPGCMYFIGIQTTDREWYLGQPDTPGQNNYKIGRRGRILGSKLIGGIPLPDESGEDYYFKIYSLRKRMVGIASGRVIDASTGYAVPSATVQIDDLKPVSTDVNGEYSLTLLKGEHTIKVTAEGYISFQDTITVPGNLSRLQYDVLLHPKGVVPEVCDVITNYFDKTRKAYFLDGISVKVRFKAIVDWGGFQPGSIKFITPKGTYKGKADTRTFDVGTEFGVGGQLKVIALSEDGTESEPYVANFEVIPIPPGIPRGLTILPKLSSSGSHVLKYGSSTSWGFTAIQEGVEEGKVPERIPVFGGKAFEFNVVIEAGIEITSDGNAKAWVVKPIDKFKIADVEFTPKIKGAMIWRYSSSRGCWIPGGSISIIVDADYTTPPSYHVIMAGPIPVPTYWRGGIEASLNTCLKVIDWLSGSSPELEGGVDLEVLGKFILGVGISGALAGEGELKGGPNLTLQFPDEPHLRSFVIHMEATVRLVSFFHTWERPLIEYNWELMGARSPFQIMGVKAIPPPEEFHPLERDYLDRGYPIFIGAHQRLSLEGTDTFSYEEIIVDREYPYSDPDLSIRDGERALVWLTDEPQRSDKNRTKLICSRWKNGGWAEPIEIDEDGTADFEPDVEIMPNGDLMVAWVNCSRILDDTSMFEDLLESCEIAVARYNSSLGSWESTWRMTNNSYLDHTPCLRVASDGTAMLVWIGNPDNNIIGSPEEPNQIWCSFFRGGIWSQPELIADRVGTILKTDLAYDGRRAVYVFSVDKDGDLEPKENGEEDKELFAIAYINGVWLKPTQLTVNGGENTNPDIKSAESGSLMLVWYKDGRIVQSSIDLEDGLKLSDINEIIEVSTFSGAVDFSLSVGSNGSISVVWQDASIEGFDLWTSTYDPKVGIWSLPYQLTHDHFLERDIIAGYDGERLVLVYNKSVREEKRWKNALCQLERRLGLDLSISADDVSFSPANPVPGEECAITVTIRNLGDLVAQDVPVAFYEGDPSKDGQLIGSTVVNEILAGSDSEPVSIVWAVPGNISQSREIFITIDPEETIPDGNRSNNVCSCRVIKPDLTVQEIYIRHLGEDKISTVFRIANVGVIPVENIEVELRKNTLDGKLLKRFRIENLDKDMFEDKSVILDKRGCGGRLYVIIDPSDQVEEFKEDNNVASSALTLAPGDVSGNAKITAYDASLVLQYVTGLIELSLEQREAADVSGNGKIDPYDAALILEYVVGLITQFPAQAAPSLITKNESQLLKQAIAELNNIPLSQEERKVLEELKRLLGQQMIPRQTALLQNYPNPFNPETWIPFQLAEDSDVKIRIYDIRGRLIKTLNLGHLRAGYYTTKASAAYWDGRNELGEKVASGIYIYQLLIGGEVFTKKMIILK
jgi:hypothetical protein